MGVGCNILTRGWGRVREGNWGREYPCGIKGSRVRGGTTRKTAGKKHASYAQESTTSNDNNNTIVNKSRTTTNSTESINYTHKTKTSAPRNMENDRVSRYHKLKGLFQFRQKEAAKHLGVSLTTIKKYCRQAGIHKWPYARQNNEVGQRSKHQQKSEYVQEKATRSAGFLGDEGMVLVESGRILSRPDMSGEHSLLNNPMVHVKVMLESDWFQDAFDYIESAK
eukprot:753324-Hanusia_phi.AAC.5